LLGLQVGTHRDEQIQHRRHAPTSEGGVDLDRQALAGEAVHPAQSLAAAGLQMSSPAAAL